jgi:hypothetical protein
MTDILHELTFFNVAERMPLLMAHTILTGIGFRKPSSSAVLKLLHRKMAPGSRHVRSKHWPIMSTCTDWTGLTGNR